MGPVGLLVVGLIIVITHWVRRWRNPKCNGVLPPGSMGLPLIGETLHLLIPTRSLDIHPFLKKRILKYGLVFRTSLAGRPMVVSADPKVNHFIFSQEGKSVEMWYLDSFSKIFNQEGESKTNTIGIVHKYVRRTTLNHFGVKSIEEKLLPQFEEMACRALDSWSKEESVELKHAIATMVFNFAAKLFFSYEPENSSDDLSKKLAGMVQSLMSFPLNIPGTAFHECMKAKTEILKVIETKLKEKRAAPQTSQVDFLDQVIQDMPKEKFLKEEFVVPLIFGLLFANFESNSSALTFALWKLSQHPTAIEKLEAEHEAVLNDRKNRSSPLTWEEYKSMAFTLQVIHESLRLANVTPGFLRRALKDIQINGYTIPAGWTILIASSAQHMNVEVFDDPLKFNPWRWKELESNSVEQNFMPFGQGMRQCAGAEFSKALMSTFLHVLVTKYRWSIVKTGNIRRTPLLNFGDGIHVKISKKE